MYSIAGIFDLPKVLSFALKGTSATLYPSFTAFI